MARVSILGCIAALALVTGCAAQKPVVRSVPGDFLGHKLAQLPRGYGIRCAAAMQARHGGAGDGAATLFDPAGRQLVTAALRFSDPGAAQLAYATTISRQTQRCYADGFVTELVRQYGVKVRRVDIGPSQVTARIGDAHSGSRVSVVVAGDRGDVTVTADSTAVRLGSALSLDQVIDVTALGRPAREPDLRLAAAVS